MTGVVFDYEPMPECMRDITYWGCWEPGSPGRRHHLYIGGDEATARSLAEWLQSQGRPANWGRLEGASGRRA